jgi:transposase-like protein
VFQPPRCPYRRCTNHVPADQANRWFVRHGHYQPKCRPHPVPRFRCLGCGRSFSRQTFRMDYRDHRPDLNAKLVELLASGVGLRQSSRLLGLSRRCLELKSRKLGRHLRRLHLNFQESLPAGSVLQLDELETFEGLRTLRPLTVPLVIDKASRYIVWAESAPIPARHRKTKHGRKRSAELARSGRRRDGSRRACRRALGRAAALTRDHGCLAIETDEKSSYPTLIRQVFGSTRMVVHGRTSSTRQRDVSNPLFAINQTEAMARDLMGRLRRQSWLASKKRRYLDLALALFMAWRNLVRRRFNHDWRSPAQILGFVPRRMSEEELCSWRQDWGRSSIHPLAWNAESIDRFAQRRRQLPG